MRDGRLLISTGAVQASKQFGGNDTLAFILSHELAHYLNNDHAEARLSQTPFSHNWMLESRADRRGLVLMTLAGFDPMAIIRQPNFLQQWANSGSQAVCAKSQTAYCMSLRQRMKALNKFFNDLIRHAVLETLAQQTFASGQAGMSIQLHQEFSRYFPAAVLQAEIGLTLLWQALQTAEADAVLFEPLVAERHMTAIHLLDHTDLRFRHDASAYRSYALRAIRQFEKARSLGANQSFLSALIAAQALAGENLSAEATLEEQYRPLFGRDSDYNYLKGALRLYTKSADSAVIDAMIAGLNTSLSSNDKQRRYWQSLRRYAMLPGKATVALKTKLRQNIRALEVPVLDADTAGGTQAMALTDRLAPMNPGDNVSKQIRRKKPRYQIAFAGTRLLVYDWKQRWNVLCQNNGIVVSVWQQKSPASLWQALFQGQDESSMIHKLGRADIVFYRASQSLHVYKNMQTVFTSRHGKLQGWFRFPYVDDMAVP